ncbi:type I 3-dehydroquinate dehydratase, partial [Oceanobacillus massiliensis]|uniref:type I 3-dehydroquinate dehydratase n=1 Tax=Oceanobacillus massiliensis TaxID=1465765 RepID=UPI00301998C4
MKSLVKVRGLTIGEGIPKICVPMIGTTDAELLEEAETLAALRVDMAEWRVDLFDHVEDIRQVKTTLKKLREILIDIPILFTFRSAKEGGEREIAAKDYMGLIKGIAETGQVDLVDVELFQRESDVKELIHTAHDNNVGVIVSNHDFEKTPPVEEIVLRLRKAQALGGDIPKIAVMPKDAGDVLKLLHATYEMNDHYADRPIITMAMAGKGVVSRLSGEVFGSSVPFAAVKKVSAPGQIGV